MFNLFNRKKEKNTNIEERNDLFSGALTFNSISSYTTNNATKLSAVYCAVNSISNAVATLPLNVYFTDIQGYKEINYTHSTQKLLSKQPSKNFSRFDFFKMICSSVMLKGNGYAIIFRDKKGNATEVKYVDSDLVTVTYDFTTDSIKYIVTGYINAFESINILHFKMYSNNGITGVSVITNAFNTLQSASDAENFSSNFYRSGAASNSVLNTTVKLTGEQKQEIRNQWDSAFKNKNSFGVVLLPQGVDYKAISINSKDAQLIESRIFNIIEIARFFNISPVKLFDLTNNSYGSAEQTNLDFLQDTINPFLVMIESEINRKLFLPSEQKNISAEFDRTALISADKKTQGEYFKTLVVNGLITPNEARKSLGFNNIEGGDDLLIQLNMTTLNNIVNDKNVDNSKNIPASDTTTDTQKQ